MLNTNYIIIPYEVYTDRRLRHFDKLLFGKIFSLSKQEGYCWASNLYLSKELNVTSSYVSHSIKKLTECEYIYLVIDHYSKNYARRKIYLNNINIVQDGIALYY